MTDLQKKEWDILTCFVRVCEELGLTYYLVCGSALGAIKYQGFIPWDDDVDVALPREDYEIFLAEAPKRLPAHLFVQNYRTDPAFPKVFTKIRDSRTTYIETDYEGLDMHHGVFIDVFALDGYPTDPADIAAFEKKKKRYLRLTSCSLRANGSRKSNILRGVLRLFGCHRRTASYLAEYEAMLRAYGHAEVYCNYGNFRGVPEKTPKEVYGTGAEAVFEGLRVRVPTQYDVYLRDKYGDYTKDPPAEEQTGHHYYAAMELSVAYDEYIKQQKTRLNP